MSTHTKAPSPRVGLNITIPRDVHGRAKAAASLAHMTWDEAAAEAFEEWAASKGIPRHQPAQRGGR